MRVSGQQVSRSTLKPPSPGSTAWTVRVIPHAIGFPGAVGFAVYQQLNTGTIDRAVQSGQITADEVAAWWAALTRAAERETFFSAVLGFIVAGRKP
jgi:hypothetical protein